MGSLNEKNFKVGFIASALAFAVLVIGGVTAGTVSAVSADEANVARYELGVACVQAGGEWRDRDADCLKR